MRKYIALLALILSVACQKGGEIVVDEEKTYTITATDMYQSAINVAAMAGVPESDVTFVLLIHEHSNDQVVAQNSVDNEGAKSGRTFTANKRAQYLTIKYEMSFDKNGTHYNTGKWVSNVIYLDGENTNVVLTSHTSVQNTEPK